MCVWVVGSGGALGEAARRDSRHLCCDHPRALLGCASAEKKGLHRSPVPTNEDARTPVPRGPVPAPNVVAKKTRWGVLRPPDTTTCQSGQGRRRAELRLGAFTVVEVRVSEWPGALGSLINSSARSHAPAASEGEGGEEASGISRFTVRNLSTRPRLCPSSSGPSRALFSTCGGAMDAGRMGLPLRALGAAPHAAHRPLC